MRYASCYRMCAIYISKSNFIRGALCIHWNRIYGMCIYGLIGFSFDAARNCKEDATKKKLKNIMVMVDI